MMLIPSAARMITLAPEDKNFVTVNIDASLATPMDWEGYIFMRISNEKFSSQSQQVAMNPNDASPLAHGMEIPALREAPRIDRNKKLP
jgi:hypothetical protein